MSDSVTAPFHITKTIIGIKNELLAISGTTHTPLLTTTLNHKYGIQAAVPPASKPIISYFGIGVNGFRNINDTNLSQPYIPSMENLDLYGPIPFRCVPVAEDLTAQERANYRMRVRKTFNGADYWCYYLKKIMFQDTDVQLTRTDPATLQETAYVIDPDNLTPTPVIPLTDGLVEVEGSEVNVTLAATLNITGVEVLESVGVIFNDARRAVVSEIGIYTGLDATVAGVTHTGATLNYTEAIYAQLAIHKCSIGVPLTTPSAYSDQRLRLGKSNVLLL